MTRRAEKNLIRSGKKWLDRAVSMPVAAPASSANAAPVAGEGLPRPLFSRVGARLFWGDALEILAAMPAASADFIFADPPYGLSNGGFTCHAGRRVSVDKGEWDKSRGPAGDFAFHRAWIAACKRALSADGSLWVSGTYHSIYACGFALQADGWHIVNDIAWFKPNAAPNLSCRMFTASHETLIWARKNRSARHHFNYDLVRNGAWAGDFLKKPETQMRSVWAIPTPPPGEKRRGKHPTQKPLALMERLILSCTREGDLVLDPFCGSATTGIAALRHKRRFVGIDSDESYLRNLAIPRLEDAFAAREEKIL